MWDIIVIGSGISGLTAATALARSGDAEASQTFNAGDPTTFRALAGDRAGAVAAADLSIPTVASLVFVSAQTLHRTKRIV